MDHKTRIKNLEKEVSDLQGELCEITKNEHRLKLAFENANIGICFVDLDGNFIETNDEMSKMFGYSKGEFQNNFIKNLNFPSG